MADTNGTGLLLDFLYNFVLAATAGGALHFNTGVEEVLRSSCLRDPATDAAAAMATAAGVTAAAAAMGAVVVAATIKKCYRCCCDCCCCC